MAEKKSTIDAKTYYQLGNEYYEKGDYEKAIENYNMAILLNPIFSEAYFNRALSYYQLKNFDKSLADYTKSAELDPNNPIIYNNRGDAYYRKQDFRSAIKDYDKAISLNPNYLKAFYNRGLSYASLEEYEKAVEDFSKVVNLKEDFAEAYHLRGLAFEYSGNISAAIADYEKALELNPELAEAKTHLEAAKAKKEQEGKGAEGGSEIKMLQRPNMTFKDVAGMDKMKEEIREAVVYPMMDPELARRYGKLGGGGIMMYGPPGCGKCVAGGTHVLLADGQVKSINEIYDEARANGRESINGYESIVENPGIEVLSLNKDNLKIEKKKVTFAYKQRYKGKIYKITTNSGRNIEVTPEHPFIIIDNGVKKAKASYLSKGCYVAIPREVSITPAKTQWYAPEIDEDVAEFSPKNIFGSGSVSLMKFFGGVPRFKLQDSSFTEIQKFIMQTEKSVVGQFLSAVFEREATVRKDIQKIEISTASADLASRLAYLLLRFGIVARIKPKRIAKNDHVCWRLYISGNENLKTFESEIGFISERKRMALKRWTKRKIRESKNIDIIPNIQKLLKEARKKLGLKKAEFYRSKNGHRYELLKNISRNYLSKIVEGKLLTKEMKALKDMSESDVMWDEVVEVKTSDFDGYVYDLTIDKNHTFVAGFGGIFVHNTYITKAAAGECKAGFINAKLSDLLDMYVGNTEKNIHKVFELARKNTPSMLFFDEVDAIGGRRDQQEGQQYMRMAVNQMLYEMDGVEAHNDNVLVIAATNAPWDVDPALRRSGRFSKTIYIPEPDLKSRIAIIKLHSKKRPLGMGIPYFLIALAAIGYSSSDLKAVVEEAATFPWREAFFAIQKKIEAYTKKGMSKEEAEEKAKKEVFQRPITAKDFYDALRKRPSSLPPWYEQAKKQIGKQEEITIIDGKEHKKVTESKMGPGEKEAFKDLLKQIETRNQLWHKIGIRIVREAALLLLLLRSLIPL